MFYEALDAAAGHKALFGNLVNADVLDLSEMSNQIPGNNKIRIILVVVIENEQKRWQQVELEYIVLSFI